MKSLGSVDVTGRQLKPTLQSMQVEDGWGNLYVVRSNADSYELRSLGKDGRPDSGTQGPTSRFTSDIGLSSKNGSITTRVPSSVSNVKVEWP